METINNNFNYEECEKNIRQQREDLRQYFSEHIGQNRFPFDKFAYNEFWHHYWHFRACLASLRKNPDTKDDEDFVALCDYWNGFNGSPFQLRKADFDELERRYRGLRAKPAFGENPIYDELFGDFVKGIYGLISGACPDYWSGFFDLD